MFPRVLHDELSSPVRSVGFEPIRALFPSSVEHKEGPIPSDTGLLVSTRLDDNIAPLPEGGGRVFLLDPEPCFPVEPTNFRLSSWDGGGPSGTIVNLKHPAMSEVPSDGWCDLQFYPLIQKSKSILLTPHATRRSSRWYAASIARRGSPTGPIFSRRSIGRGKLLVSGFNFGQALKSGDPAAVFLFDRLVRYALGSDFKPKESLPVNVIRTKVAK